MAKRKIVKVHMSRKKRTLRGNLKMFCDKTFSSGDRERLRRHVTGNIEDVNCLECIHAILEHWQHPGKKFFRQGKLVPLEEVEIGR